MVIMSYGVIDNTADFDSAISSLILDSSTKLNRSRGLMVKVAHS